MFIVQINGLCKSHTILITQLTILSINMMLLLLVIRFANFIPIE